MQENRAEIYLVTNNANGKIYVGRTISGFQKRWREHVWHSKNKRTVLGRAIQKHGASNFSVRVLETITTAEAETRERYWIAALQATKRTVGYNTSDGASGANIVGPTTRQRLSEVSKQFWNSFTPEERTAMLRARTKGRKKSEEHKRNLARSKAGIPQTKHDSTSRYVGVCVKRRGQYTYWTATCYHGHICRSRIMPDEISAAQCYDRFALALRGTDATINFPKMRAKYLKEDLIAFLNNIKRPTSAYRYVVFKASQTIRQWNVRYMGKIHDRFNCEQEAIAFASKLTGLSPEQLRR